MIYIINTLLAILLPFFGALIIEYGYNTFFTAHINYLQSLALMVLIAVICLPHTMNLSKTNLSHTEPEFDLLSRIMSMYISYIASLIIFYILRIYI